MIEIAKLERGYNFKDQFKELCFTFCYHYSDTNKSAMCSDVLGSINKET